MSMVMCRDDVSEEFTQPWHESHEISEQPEFVESVKNAARNYLEAFFHNRDMYCGGPISPQVLYSKAAISTVMNTDSESGCRRAYAAMARDNFKQGQKNKETEDILFVISIFKECAKLGIPKCFRPGVLLVYLELCEGIRVD